MSQTTETTRTVADAATPYELLCRADALLHDMPGEHAAWAHALVHQAAAHLSEVEAIRDQAAEETPVMLRALDEIAGANGATAGRKPRPLFKETAS